MTRLTDGKKTAEIRMTEWTGNGYGPDWSNDFFEVGALKYDPSTEAYQVEDVDYCVVQAQDWAAAKGDYREDEDINTDNRSVDVNYIF